MKQLTPCTMMFVTTAANAHVGDHGQHSLVHFFADPVHLSVVLGAVVLVVLAFVGRRRRRD